MKVFLSSGMTAADFRQGGMMDSDVLKILVKTSKSCSAHFFNTIAVTPSGPAAFLGSSARRVVAGSWWFSPLLSPHSECRNNIASGVNLCEQLRL